MWIPESVLLGPAGPRWFHHRDGIAVGHPGRVVKVTRNGEQISLAHWFVSNHFGARNTLALAIKMYDPFQ